MSDATLLSAVQYLNVIDIYSKYLHLSKREMVSLSDGSSQLAPYSLNWAAPYLLASRDP